VDFILPDSIEFYSRFLIGGTGVLAFVIRLRNYFSETRKKQNLKTDLEILSLTEKNNLTKVDIVRERVNEQITAMYDPQLRGNSNFSNFITGLIVFIGFGLWTADLFKNSYPDFNPWTIATLFCSVIGFSMMIFDDTKTEKKEPFIRIGIYDKTNLRFAAIITIVSGVILAYLIRTSQTFNFGMFISGLFCFIGVLTFVRNIKRIN
jgi:hypothetical protein